MGAKVGLPPSPHSLKVMTYLADLSHSVNTDYGQAFLGATGWLAGEIGFTRAAMTNGVRHQGAQCPRTQDPGTMGMRHRAGRGASLRAGWAARELQGGRMHHVSFAC